MKWRLLVAVALVVAAGAAFAAWTRTRSRPASAGLPPPSSEMVALPRTTVPAAVQPISPVKAQVRVLQARSDAERAAIDRLRQFEQDVHLSPEQQRRFEQALFDAKRNLGLAHAEEQRVVREGLEEHASVERRGKKYMTPEDAERFEHWNAQRGQAVDDQALDVIDQETDVRMKQLLEPDQYARYRSAFRSFRRFLADLPMSSD